MKDLCWKKGGRERRKGIFLWNYQEVTAVLFLVRRKNRVVTSGWQDKGEGEIREEDEEGPVTLDRYDFTNMHRCGVYTSIEVLQGCRILWEGVWKNWSTLELRVLRRSLQKSFERNLRTQPSLYRKRTQEEMTFVLPRVNKDLDGKPVCEPWNIHVRYTRPRNKWQHRDTGAVLDRVSLIHNLRTYTFLDLPIYEWLTLKKKGHIILCPVGFQRQMST